jgi:hypothetical protein
MRRRLFRAKIASGKILAVLLSTLSRRKGGFRADARKFSHEFKSFARNA